MKLSIERRYPFYVSLVLSIIVFLFFYSLPVSQGISELFSALINVSAIGVGFLSTSMAILFTMAKEWIIRALKDTKKNYYQIVISYFLKAIYAASFLALNSCIGLMMRWNLQLNILHRLFFSIWLLSFLLFILTYQRIIYIFFLILKLSHKKD